MLLSAAIEAKAEEVTCAIDPVSIESSLFKAVRKFAGYGALSGLAEGADIDGSLKLSPSEWAVIQPLFAAYCEYEQAVQIEATRQFGMSEFGRASSEVMADVRTLETELPSKAFKFEVITI